MESIHANENRASFDTLPEQLFPAECNDSGEPDACDDFMGAPEIAPRIGTESQAEIPPLEEEFKYITSLGNSENSQNNFLIGLPIPLMWTSLKHDVSSKNSIETIGLRGKRRIQIEHSNDSRRCIGKDECRFLVPGLSSEPWSDVEKSSFLLGLYIFEKNFVEVRHFVETKGMGAILSFYYGEFYGSSEHRRWSESRQTKSKKCVHGQCIFSGWRQQELISRILPKVSEECRTTLAMVSKMFGDEKMAFRDYVFSLKAMVGMKNLVDAVGIGTGKQDLTGKALEPSKSNHANSLRPKIPPGKALSSLTTAEITNFLCGGYRLSKARSHDLFWDAVWPRLLARGWHSEQPNNQGYLVGLKNSLVFLVPGIKKFSRRKLVRGNQYFDSVSDVLNKVAREPGLLELDFELETCEKINKECDLTSENKVENDDEDRPKQRHNYLQPRTPSRCSNFVKFTVVDTSLSNGQVRELRGLPSQISNTMTVSRICIEDADDKVCIETSDDSEMMSAILCNVSVMGNSNAKTTKPSEQKHFGALIPKSSSSLEDISKVFPRGKTDLRENTQSRKVSKSFSGPKPKRAVTDHIAPAVKKCRKVAAWSSEVASDALSHLQTVPKSENAMSSCSSGVFGFTGYLSSGAVSCQDKLSSTSSSRGSPCESVDCATYSNTETLTLIDLNMPPQVPMDFENDIFTADLQKENADHRNNPDDSRLSDFSSVVGEFPHVTEQRSELLSDVNPRRQSTRNRPPTTRALEALANGYLTVNRKKKSKESRIHEDIPSRPWQHPPNASGPADFTNSFGHSQVEEAEGVGKSNVLNKFGVLPQGNEETDFRQ